MGDKCCEEVRAEAAKVDTARYDLIGWLQHAEAQASLMQRMLVECKKIVSESEGLKEVVAQLPSCAEVDLAIRANNMGGLEYREDYCRCAQQRSDASVGCAPCPYCAIDAVLNKMLRALTKSQDLNS